MCKCKEYIMSFIKREWSLPEKIFCTSTFLFAGVVMGFTLAPIKKGIQIKWSLGSHNGCGNGSNSGNGNKGNKGKVQGKKEKNNHKEAHQNYPKK